MFDWLISNWVISWRNPVLTWWFETVTWLGNWQVVGIVWVGIGWYYWTQERKYRWLWSSTLLGVGLINLIKVIVKRPRPPLEWALVGQGGYSFPSGHSFVAVAVYGWIVYWAAGKIKNKSARTAWIILGTAIVLMVPVSRVYLGVHWASDILGGVAIGGLWLTGMIYGDVRRIREVRIWGRRSRIRSRQKPD
jgi:undecaprenyl-diphosphatase